MYYFDLDNKALKAKTVMADYFSKLEQEAESPELEIRLRDAANNARSGFYELLREEIAKLPQAMQDTIPAEFTEVMNAVDAYIQSGDDNEDIIASLDQSYDAVIALK